VCAPALIALQSVAQCEHVCSLGCFLGEAQPLSDRSKFKFTSSLFWLLLCAMWNGLQAAEDASKGMCVKRYLMAAALMPDDA